jgi:hypothetical protein
MNHLNLELRIDPAAPLQFISTYTNQGTAPLALTFWWNRRLRVVDTTGVVIEPAKGPVLPCGVAEDWRVLAPGERHDEVQTLGCTQPAGRSEPIGWAYALAPGTYQVTLVFESPPAHGFSQAAPHPHAFAGRVESNEVELVVPVPAPRGFFERLLGR